MTELLQLSVDQRKLYVACHTTGMRPTNIACHPEELKCYKCYCFEAMSASMYK